MLSNRIKNSLKAEIARLQSRRDKLSEDQALRALNIQAIDAEISSLEKHLNGEKD